MIEQLIFNGIIAGSIYALIAIGFTLLDYRQQTIDKRQETWEF